jgi:IS605 OrfB family transposase
MPQMPKPRKMSQLLNYSIPLDGANGWSTKKNLIGINLKKKMRYFYIGKIIKNGKVLDKTIQSVAIKMRNSEIYLSFSYINENEKSTESTIQKPQELDPIELNSAGIDIGLNNLISLFIDDKKSQSIIVDGARYKYYNSKFNRFIAKLNNSISEEIIEFKTIIKKDKTEVQIPIKWTKKGHRLKRYISFLYRKRNDFFETEFHKISKRVVEYLEINDVKRLVLSKNLAQLMNNGKCKLRKKTKQNFIQIPFIQLIHYIEEKAIKNGIKVIFIDEAYTSKTSCISGDILAVQTKSKNNQKPLANEFKGTRAKRGLFKDIVLNKIWNADLNGAVNHIKVAFNSCFKWLKKTLFKLCNPKVIKSANDFLIFNNGIVMQVKSGYQVPLKR